MPARLLVFDAFVALDRRAEVVVLWPEVSLAEPERAALERIAACLGFLGRAESWVEARALRPDEATDAARRVNAWPAASAAATRDMEPVRLLCADRTVAFHNDHTPKLVRIEGRGAARRRIETLLYDPDWHPSLLADFLASSWRHEKRGG
jgi:CRISPR-associated protein Csb2